MRMVVKDCKDVKDVKDFRVVKVVKVVKDFMAAVPVRLGHAGRVTLPASS